MVYVGRVQNGVVVLDHGQELAEGTVVRVEPVTDRGEQDPQSLYDRLKPVIGIVEGLPPDLAKNHEHDLHGLPKK